MSGGAQLSISAGHVRLTVDGTLDERRPHDDASLATLQDLTQRYAALVEHPQADGLLGVGRELLTWLDGSEGWWKLLHDTTPLTFEVRGPVSPDAAAWAVLRAPWEVLADDTGFLAEDTVLGYAPMRRLGPVREPDPIDEHRLALAFMASAPRGATELDYEAEENAIMTVAGGLDLEVEDSGNAEQFGLRLSRIRPPLPVLHLSCHGHNAWKSNVSGKAVTEPVLFMEDPEGNPVPTTAAALIEALNPYKPQLLFLSACLTARAADGGDAVAHSLATALVRAGLPAVMGWNGSVADVAATAFAGVFYAGLGRMQTPTVAAATARRALLRGKASLSGSPEPKDAGSSRAFQQLFEVSASSLKRDWHLAQLWVGPAGGGPIVGGERKRSLLGPDHGHKQLLSRKDAGSEVASAAIFVGRRRELQNCLKALGDGKHNGVLIHGLGYLGKSSLAARLASRRGDLKLAVLYGRYDAGSVVDALLGALEDYPPARDLLKARQPAVLDEAEHGTADALHKLLVDLLAGPCRQRSNGRPVLVLIDDLERVLEPDAGGGRHRVVDTVRPVLSAILRAFAPERSDSRLVLTSRLPFTLKVGGTELADRLWPLALGGLSEAARRKLMLRQVLGAREGGMQSADLSGRLELVDRARAVARGHPGLQDFIGHRLVLSPAMDVANAEEIVAEMEGYLVGGAQPKSSEVRAYLQDLGLGRLLELAGSGGRALLRAGLLFDLPVAEPVMAALAKSIGGDVQWLVDLGLLEPLEDVVRAGSPALAVGALARPMLEPLHDSEVETLAAEVVNQLYMSWGGNDQKAKRPLSADLLLTKLGLAAGSAEVVSVCANNAVHSMERRSFDDAVRLGQQAIALLDRERVAPPLELLASVVDLLARSGQVETADALLRRAINRAQSAAGTRDAGPLASLRCVQGDRAMTFGRLDEAQALYSQAAQLAASLGEVGARDYAGALARVADVHQARGELGAALRIRRDEQLPIFKRFGDTRSQAVTMGQIADLHRARGDFDEALRICREDVLPILERLGDLHSRAVTMNRVAAIWSARGDPDAALKVYRADVLPVFQELGDARWCAATMGKIAGILSVRGEESEALRILRSDVVPVFERFGDERARAVAMGQIADVHRARGELDEALRIYRDDQLPVFERVSDLREQAVTMIKIADIHRTRGDLDHSFRILSEHVLPLFRRLGDLRSLAGAIGQIAEVYQARGDLEGALQARRSEQLPLFERLGDIRQCAVTIGKIADIHLDRGEADDALRVRRDEQLPLYTQLEDHRERAITLLMIAKILMSDRTKLKARAKELAGVLRDAYAIGVQLNLLEIISAAGGWLGPILAANGQNREARRVLTNSANAFEALGRGELASKVRQSIATLRA